MAKGQQNTKEAKKKPALTQKEKKAAKKEKAAAKDSLGRTK